MRRLLTHLFALLLGAGIASGIHACREYGRGMASWGKPQVFTDREVREKIESLGIKIPPTARDLYFGVIGFVDPEIYVGMTLGTNDWAGVRMATGMGKEAFSTRWSKEIRIKGAEGPSIAMALDLRGPGSYGPEYLTELWRPARMRSPWFHQEATEVKPGQVWGADVIFDPSTGRLLIHRWET